ncbi:MAG: class I SAM-dependent methyltransferase [Chloroflexi bacterium]|nr:class I SAM-dependent methyltransferase [Chloroflexota bacterium]
MLTTNGCVLLAREHRKALQGPMDSLTPFPEKAILAESLPEEHGMARDTEPADLNADVQRRWDTNAEWWDEQFGEGNAFQRVLIGPATERLLALKPGEQVLDIACGNGAFSRRMAELGAEVTAFDFSPRFIARARSRTTTNADRIRYLVVDATNEAALLTLGSREFDAAVCSMAFMDMSNIEPLLAALTQLLRPGGRLVFSVLHPCFNNSHGTTLMLEEEDREGTLVETLSVKVRKYISSTTALGVGIAGQPVPQVYFHRPISALYNACFRAGLVLDGIEEPVFGDGDSARHPLGWANFKEIPPVLVSRMRLPAR